MSAKALISRKELIERKSDTYLILTIRLEITSRLLTIQSGSKRRVEKRKEE